MLDGQTPRWLKTLEKRLGWLAIPNIAVILVTLQAAGFIFVMMDPIWIARLALIPGAVRAGEFWRLITFLALPLAASPIWVIFVLWFLYFITNAIESRWGSFKTTLYILVAWLVTIAFSFAFNYPITTASDFQSTLFLASAALFPEMEVQLFMVVPVKMKWLGWLTMGYVGLQFLRGDLGDKLYLIAIYSSYIVFFGPALVASGRQRWRRWNFKRRL